MMKSWHNFVVDKISFNAAIEHILVIFDTLSDYKIFSISEIRRDNRRVIRDEL